MKNSLIFQTVQTDVSNSKDQRCWKISNTCSKLKTLLCVALSTRYVCSVELWHKLKLRLHALAVPSTYVGMGIFFEKRTALLYLHAKGAPYSFKEFWG